MFNVRHANGNASPDTARETRSQSSGRWMAPGKRPVLCLAHVRVTIPVGFLSPQSPVCNEQAKPEAERGNLDRGPTGNFIGQASTSGIAGVKATVNRCHRRDAESAGSDEGDPQEHSERSKAFPERSEDYPDRSEAQENVVRSERRRDPPLAKALHDRGEVGGAEKETAANVVDFIATGDTGGTVTLWEFLPAGEGVAPSEGEDSPRSSQVKEGFIHRGPSGRRRGGVHAGGESATGTPQLRFLVPVLEYRAHQVMRTTEIER